MASTYPAPLPPLPAGAWGFVATRPDRPERLALYRADGRLNNSFGQGGGFDEAFATIRRTYPAATWRFAEFPAEAWVIFGLPSD